MLHVQAMQQRDQSRPGSVFDGAFTRDLSAHVAGGAWLRRGDPDPQFVLLFGGQWADAALVAEVRQTGAPSARPEQGRSSLHAIQGPGSRPRIMKRTRIVADLIREGFFGFAKRPHVRFLPGEVRGRGSNALSCYLKG
jgi:hypothetical protein